MYGKGTNWTRYMTDTKAGVELEYYMWKRHAPVCFHMTATGVMRIKGKHVDDAIYEGKLIMVPVCHKKHHTRFDEWVRKTKQENPDTKWAAYIEVEGYPDHAAMVSSPCRCVPVDNFFSFCGEPEPDKVREPESTALTTMTGDDFWKVRNNPAEDEGETPEEVLERNGYYDALMKSEPPETAVFSSPPLKDRLYNNVWYDTEILFRGIDGVAYIEDGVRESTNWQIYSLLLYLDDHAVGHLKIYKRNNGDLYMARFATEGQTTGDLLISHRHGWECFSKELKIVVEFLLSERRADHGEKPKVPKVVPSWLDQTLDDMDILWKSFEEKNVVGGVCPYVLELCSTPVSEDGAVDDYGTLVVCASPDKPRLFAALHDNRLVVQWGELEEFIHDLEEKLPESIRAYNNYHSYTGEMWFDAEQLFAKNSISWARLKDVQIDDTFDWFWDIHRYDARREHARFLVDAPKHFRLQIRECAEDGFYEAWDTSDPRKAVCLVERVKGWQFFADRLLKALKGLLPPLVTDPPVEPNTKEEQSDGLRLL